MRIFLILSLVVMLLALGGGGYMAFNGGTAFFGSKEGREVRVREIVRENLIEIVSAPGEIEPNVKVDVSAEVSARIMKMPFREGDAVRKGDVIIRLDAVAFEARLESAKARRDAQRFQLQSEQSRLAGPIASLENARANLKRQEALFETGDISRQRLDDSRNTVNTLVAQVEAGKLAVSVLESTLAAAEAEIEQAKEALSKTVMIAPIDGVITILNAEIGELVMVGTMNNPGTVIMTIADLTRMRLNARVSEADVANVREHQPAIVRINAYRDEEFNGTVDRLALQRAIDRDGSGYFKAEIQIDLDGREIYSGLAANVDIEIAEHVGVVVPSQAVLDVEVEEIPEHLRDHPLVDLSKKTSQLVFRMDGTKAMLAPVRIGPSNLSNTIISEGLEVGDRVVVGPYKALDKLKDSDQVRIMDVEADPKAGRDQTDDVQPDANSESLSLTAGSS